ncbi:MAG: AMP-binding protein [Oscillospiraceae bacterium]|jgi:long-chain acyl-CoA synthetase|nr:AMP-binding protein [Oscillospiraceae bacterium]
MREDLENFFKSKMDKEAIDRLHHLDDLGEFLQYINSKFSDKKAFVYKEGEEVKSINYAQMYDAISKLSAFLQKENKNGEKIAIIANPSPKWVETFLAITSSSNVAVVVPSSAKLNSIIGILKMSNAKCVIYDKANEENIKGLKSKLEDIQFLPMDPLFETKSVDNLQISPISPDAPAAIFFTSGTTALSKGVTLTHKNIMVNAYNGMLGVPLPGGVCRCLLALPLFHVLGLLRSVLTILYQGGEVHFPENIKTFFKDFAWSRPTVMVLIPEQANAVTNMIKAKGVSVTGGELKTIITGGATMQAKFKQTLFSYGIDLLQGYGLTECLLVCANAEREKKLSSVGKPYPGNNIKIKDKEILVKGEGLFLGYLSEKDTKKSFEDGWFKTGDFGHFDEDGFLYVTGRKKFLIILSNGENISPEELESKILENDSVQEALVYETQIGSETKVLGVELYAPELEYQKVCEIINQVNDTLPFGSKMRVITKRDEPFAKTPSNKIIRNGFQNTIFTRLKQTFVESPLINANPDSVVMDARLVEDLEMSSIAFAELLCDFEEKFSVKADLDEISKMSTIRDAYNYLQKNYNG